jgi:Na+/alanine symporter
VEEVKKGKKLLITTIVISLAFNYIGMAIISSLMHNFGRTNEAITELTQGVIRFAFLCLLFWFVYNGHNWARVSMVVLYGLVGIVSLMRAFTDLVYFAAAILNIAIVIMLLSEPVKAFQEYKRGDNVYYD